MRRSGLFAPARQETQPQSDDVSVSATYLERLGYVSPIASGLYTHLPLGFTAFENLKRVLNRNLAELTNCSFHEFPALHPVSLWERSGRLEKFGDSIYRLKDQRNRSFLLAPTHEVTAADMAAKFMKSRRDLPVRVSQIQIKYRNETRPRGGIIRTRQFTMHDAYSFDRGKDEATVAYELFKEAYVRTFADIRLPILISEQADMGSIGGDRSHEFHVPSKAGDDVIRDPGGAERQSLEVAHIFMLGTSYSEPMEAFYVASDGSKLPIYMCSYGMGIERTVAAYVETYFKATEKDQVKWSWELSPFQIMVLGRTDTAFAAYTELRKQMRVLIDDRDIRFGEVLAEGFQFGFPIYLVAGARSTRGEVEVHCRRLSVETKVHVDELADVIEDLRRKLECVELADCYGRCVSIDSASKTAVVAFDAQWKLTAPLYKPLDAPTALMGNFGPSKPLRQGHKRLRFGDYWIIPIVRADSDIPFAAGCQDGIRYVAYGDLAGAEKLAEKYYREELAGYREV